MKIHQIPHVIFKTISQLFFKLCITLLKLYMIWTKGTHQSGKFQTYDYSGEISPNLYFDKLLFLKVYKILVKKSIKELCLMTIKSDAKFEEKLTCFFKNDKNLVNFDPSTQNCQNFHFDWFFLCKVH